MGQDLRNLPQDVDGPKLQSMSIEVRDESAAFVAETIESVWAAMQALREKNPEQAFLYLNLTEWRLNLLLYHLCDDSADQEYLDIYLRAA